MRFETKCVRAAITPDPTTGAIVPPLYQSATYVLPEIGKDLGFDYTRSANPTRQMMEEQLAEIEGVRFGLRPDPALIPLRVRFPPPAVAVC